MSRKNLKIEQTTPDLFPRLVQYSGGLFYDGSGNLIPLNLGQGESQGPTGTQGSQGPQGFQGFQGPTGSNGTQGTQGPTGVTGTGGVIGLYGSFYDTSTQINAGVTASNLMRFNSTDFSNGIFVTGPNFSRILIENSGVYNIQFSAQIDKTDSGSDQIDIWIRKNGQNIDDSNTTIEVVGNNAETVASWNWLVNASSNDYYEIIWSSPDASMRLLSRGTQSNPPRPSIPSVILTVFQTTYTQIGPTGSQGPQGFQGVNGSQGPQGNTGSQGPQGNTGSQGPQGFQGDTGNQGSQGPQGFQGNTGSQGPQGFQGDTGSQGPQGFQGDTGNQGSQGPQGFQGDTGSQGPQGDTGSQGPQGFTGSQGPQGFTGSQGPQGDTGSQGPQGFQGSTGSVLFGTTIREFFQTLNSNISHGGCDFNTSSNTFYSVVNPDTLLRISNSNGIVTSTVSLPVTPAATCRIFQNDLYVSITGASSRLLRYDINNIGLTPAVVQTSSPISPMSNPIGIDFHIGTTTSRLFVADLSNNRVTVFNVTNPGTYSFMTTISTGASSFPAGVAVDSTNNILYIQCRNNPPTTQPFLRRVDLTTYATIGNDSFTMPASVPGAGLIYDPIKNLVYMGGLADTGNNTPVNTPQSIRCYISGTASDLVLNRIFSVDGRIGGLVIRNGLLYAGLSSFPSQFFKIAEIQI